jgi:hypothetical protein
MIEWALISQITDHCFEVVDILHAGRGSWIYLHTARSGTTH